MARKRRRQYKPSAYTLMWVLVMFDLPVTSKLDMRRATRFRHSLEELGFVRKQFSVYIRHCDDMESAKRLSEQVGSSLPDDGLVSIIFVTDRQYGLSRNFAGKVRKRNEKQERDAHGQLFLF